MELNYDFYGIQTFMIHGMELSYIWYESIYDCQYKKDW
jgi:hypothetical protein